MMSQFSNFRRCIFLYFVPIIKQFHIMINLPKGYQTVMPYLILNGADTFFNFVKEVFNAEELLIHRNEDGGIMHAEIQIGGSTIMIGGSSEQWAVQNAGLYINVENADHHFEKALSNGAEVVMPLANKEYGRSGGVLDPTGNTWWITQVPTK